MLTCICTYMQKHACLSAAYKLKHNCAQIYLHIFIIAHIGTVLSMELGAPISMPKPAIHHRFKEAHRLRVIRPSVHRTSVGQQSLISWCDLRSLILAMRHLEKAIQSRGSKVIFNILYRAYVASMILSISTCTFNRDYVYIYICI